MDENKELWHKCVEFHGHACGGLTIGYKAALYAIERMGLRLGGRRQRRMPVPGRGNCVHQRK